MTIQSPILAHSDSEINGKIQKGCIIIENELSLITEMCNGAYDF